jgi:MtrB/PioB family decaheme-associated outer membrane protein
MAHTNKTLIASLSLGLLLFAFSRAQAQIEVGDYTLRGQAEIGGLPRSFHGDPSKFEEYRDIPESVIVPQIQLEIDSKKNDFYFEFDSSKLGLDDQNYRLRMGRYGLLDMTFEWDQIPHIFNVDTARTPYTRNDGVYTLSSKATTITAAGTQFRDWLNGAAVPVDLKLFNGIGKFNVRYTPTPGWTFTGGYWSNNNAGTRSFGALFGSSPGTFNITELVEPISYNTNNIELGTEYAGKGWSIALKYNGSFFHNNVSTLTWDNPVNLTGLGAACVDQANYTANSAGLLTSPGACRGRMDLYPSNQAHTIALTGAAQLPMKTQFMGTVSYGWRLQNDSFLPGTTNNAALNTFNGGRPLAISNSNLGGNVQPMMVNATLTNNAIDHLNLKAFYRYYNLANNSRNITLTDGWMINDAGPRQDVGETLTLRSYSKNTMGLEAGYDFTRWLTAKFAYGYERLHRADTAPGEPTVNNSNEFTFGPTIDIKPTTWTLFRLAYKHSWRDAPDYNVDAQKFFEAKRERDRVSLFSEITPWEKLSFHAGFEFTGDKYPGPTYGTANDFNYSPSIGLIYTPADWIKLFADYNFDRSDWKLDARATSAWVSRGRDMVNTVTLGSDIEIIRDLLGLRLQYGFSDGVSKVSASGNNGGTPLASNYPSIVNNWNEFLARLEYKFHKNFALNLGYYYNNYHSKDYGVDIMQPWMGDFVDPGTSAGTLGSLRRSLFLGDRLKGSYSANVGFVSLKIKF